MMAQGAGWGAAGGATQGFLEGEGSAENRLAGAGWGALIGGGLGGAIGYLGAGTLEWIIGFIGDPGIARLVGLGIAALLAIAARNCALDPAAPREKLKELTDEMEQAAAAYIDKIDRLGGIVRAIEEGYPQREIANSAYQFQREVDAWLRHAMPPLPVPPSTPPSEPCPPATSRMVFGAKFERNFSRMRVCRCISH